jgi:hypothetical protein
VIPQAGCRAPCGWPCMAGCLAAFGCFCHPACARPCTSAELVQLTSGESFARLVPPAAMTEQRKYVCQYTHMKTQKTKKWKDGHLVVCGRKAQLFSEEGRFVEEAYITISPDEDDYDFERHLVHVDEPECGGGSTQESAGPCVASSAPPPHARPAAAASRSMKRRKFGVPRPLAQQQQGQQDRHHQLPPAAAAPAAWQRAQKRREAAPTSVPRSHATVPPSFSSSCPAPSASSSSSPSSSLVALESYSPPAGGRNPVQVLRFLCSRLGEVAPFQLPPELAPLLDADDGYSDRDGDRGGGDRGGGGGGGSGGNDNGRLAAAASSASSLFAGVDVATAAGGGGRGGGAGSCTAAPRQQQRQHSRLEGADPPVGRDNRRPSQPVATINAGGSAPPSSSVAMGLSHQHRPGGLLGGRSHRQPLHTIAHNRATSGGGGGGVKLLFAAPEPQAGGRAPPPRPARTVVVPDTFATAAQYADLWSAALREEINLQLSELAARYTPPPPPPPPPPPRGGA